MRRAVVLGTGSMAPEIAAALAGAGAGVTVAGRDARRAEDAAERARALVPGSRIGAAPTAPAALAGAEVVVETIVEDAAAKRALLAAVEPWCPAKALIVTNTSSLRVADLAGALRRPERFAGLHFLKPAHLTAVVEVVPGPATAEGALRTARELARAMGKAPLVVRRDVPGFIWNRVQFAVLRECLHMLEAGVASAADIDAAVSDGLAPRWTAAGPLATADLGGLATFARVAARAPAAPGRGAGGPRRAGPADGGRTAPRPLDGRSARPPRRAARAGPGRRPAHRRGAPGDRRMITWSAHLSTLFAALPPLERPAAARAAGFTTAETWWPAAEDPARWVDAMRAAGLRAAIVNADGGDLAAGRARLRQRARPRGRGPGRGGARARARRRLRRRGGQPAGGA